MNLPPRRSSHRRLSPSAKLGAAMLTVFVVLAVLGPIIAPYPAIETM